MSKQLSQTAALSVSVRLVKSCFSMVGKTRCAPLERRISQPSRNWKPSFQALIMIYIDICFVQLSRFEGLNIVHPAKPAGRRIDWLDGRVLSGSKGLYLKRKFLLSVNVEKLKGNEISDIRPHLQIDKFPLIRGEISSYVIPGESATKKLFSRQYLLKQPRPNTEVIKGES